MLRREGEYRREGEASRLQRPAAPALQAREAEVLVPAPPACKRREHRGVYILLLV